MKRMIRTLAILLGTVAVAFGADGWVSLFDGKTLDGWRQINGEATYAVENGAIVGTSVYDSPNSFLRSEKTYGDFVLELEAKLDTPLNSGVQFRSLSTPEFQNGRVHGYQLELDSSERGWTGGLYDEARNGWLYSLTRQPKARAAYKTDDWNSFRIEAIGNSIRTWINGVQATNLVVGTTAEGFIALQVHGIGKDAEKLGKQVRWRNIRIKTAGLEKERRADGGEIEEFNYVANTLTDAQKAAGWKLLWDGKTGQGWRGVRSEGFPETGWEIQDGVLSVLSSGRGGDIYTLQEFRDFELELDYRIAEGANSGIKYFCDPVLLKEEGTAIGLEFQLLDDARHPDAKLGVAGNRTSGGLYDLIAPFNSSEPGVTAKRINMPGTWNRVRIVARGNHVEHWLNNSKIVDYERGTQMFRALVANSKYAPTPNFGEWEKGPILLQDHGDLVSFRSIKIRDLTK